MSNTPDFSFKNNAEDFDSHISKSIRGYSDLISDVVSMSKRFVSSESKVLDIGCTTGSVLKSVCEATSKGLHTVDYLGIDIEPAFEKTRCRLDNLEDNITYGFETNDIVSYLARNSTSNRNKHSMILSLFTLQFVQMNKRQEVLKNLYDSLQSNGVLFFAEKVSLSEPINELLQDINIQRKREFFTDEEILNKENSLLSIMKPLTLQKNMDMLKVAGFKSCNVIQIWQNHRFVAHVAIKD